MKQYFRILPLALAAFGLMAESTQAQFQTVWQAGQPLRGWPLDGVGGGPDVDFVQEAGINPPPGNPDSTPAAQQADDDYYFAGTYPTPIGTVDDELAFERAFAGTDNNLRIHFNLDGNVYSDGNLARFTVEPFNLQGDQADPRYGVEVYFNGNLIMPEELVRSDRLNTLITSPEFTLGEVGAVYGPGGDNVVELVGINYNADGGGNWMGMDYHALEVDPSGPAPIPTLSEWGLIIFSLLLLTVGVIRIRNQAPAMAMAPAGGVSMMMQGDRKPLFVPQVFVKCLVATWLLACVGLGIAIAVTGGLPVRDIVGTMISATIVAFLAHTLLPSQEDAKE